MATPKKYEHINFTPPSGVAKAAEKGLEMRAKASPSNRGGLTPSQASQEGIGSGVQRAVNLKNRTTVSPKVVKQMKAFFARHEKNKGVKEENKGTPWNDKGYVAWLLWGGDPGKTWAEKIVGQMEKADEKEKQSKKASDNVPDNPKLWAKVIKLTKGELKSLSGNGKTFKTPNADNPDKPDGFTKYPSAYANGWASNVYKELGGTWSKKKKEKKSKEYKMPRKWDKDHCESKTCDEMGFSEEASCAPYKKCPKKASVGTHRLPPLPYPYTALEPIISGATLHFHHTKHHQSYVDGLNKAEIGLERARQERNARLVSAFTEDIAFNWGGHFLHTIYWHCLSSERKGVPPFLMGLIIREFGSFDNFYFNFVEIAKSVKGSGWAVLVLRNGKMRTPKLDIVGVKNHEHQVLWASHVLLPIDVWEHAYYLDHQNDRESHFESIFHDLVNWNYVQSRLLNSLQSRLVSQTLRKFAKGKAKKDVGKGGLDEWFSGHGQGKSKNKGKATWGDWIAISPVKRTITREDGSKKTYEPGDIIGPCGTVSNDDDWKDLTNNGKSPFKCMARPKAHKIPKKERAELAKNKQKAEKGNNTQKPTNTPTFKKEKKAMKSLIQRVAKRHLLATRGGHFIDRSTSPSTMYITDGNTAIKLETKGKYKGKFVPCMMNEMPVGMKALPSEKDWRGIIVSGNAVSEIASILRDPNYEVVAPAVSEVRNITFSKPFDPKEEWEMAIGIPQAHGEPTGIPSIDKKGATISSRILEDLFYAFQKELGDSSRGSGAGVSGFDEEDLEIRRNGVMRFRYHHYSIGRVNYKAIKDVLEFIIKRKGYQVTFLDDHWKRGHFSLQIKEMTDKKGATRNKFEIHHRSYTNAMQEAYDYAEANGYLVDEEDVFQQVTTGRGKPRVGETRKHSLGLWGFQSGKKQRKALQIQVYAMESGTYELNVYIL